MKSGTIDGHTKTTVERATYTISEAGRRLGLGRNAAYRAARLGQIPIIQIGGKLLVPIALLEEMLAQPQPRIMA